MKLGELLPFPESVVSRTKMYLAAFRRWKNFQGFETSPCWRCQTSRAEVNVSNYFHHECSGLL